MYFQKERNTLTFKPCGFKKNVNFTFADGGLSVCSTCKRNCKTKYQCRTRDAHCSPPIRETFIGIILDESCTDDHERLKDVSFVTKRIDAQPCKVKLDHLDASLPVCSKCEAKNYSRTHCRLRKKHQELPWTTTCFYLTASDERNEQRPELGYTSSKFPEIGNCLKKRKLNTDGEESREQKKALVPGLNSEKRHFVPKSRAFLARICTVKNTLDVSYFLLDEDTTKLLDCLPFSLIFLSLLYIFRGLILMNSPI